MTFSGNEIMGLMAKAARGAGAPPEQASQFGRAALHHVLGGRDLDDLVSALDALPGGPILEMPLVLLRLLEDGNGDDAQGRVTATALAQSYVEALPFRQEVMADGEHFSVTLYLTEPAAPIPPARVELTADTTAHLSELAARILVPESEASRLAGAGAGLTDND